MSSYTISGAITFTLTHARHLAAKVATDLKRMQRFYGVPSDSSIEQYEQEIILLLQKGYLGTVTYGFRKNDSWIEPTLQYTARDLAGDTPGDDDPGRVRPRADISGASFYSYLTYSTLWGQLSESEKEEFKHTLPFYRTGAAEPKINGYLHSDREYSAGGRVLQRASVRAS